MFDNNEDNFFDFLDNSPKCEKCPVKKMYSESYKRFDDPIICKKGDTLDLLIIVEMYDERYLNFLNKFLQKKNFTNYAIVAGINCNNPTYSLPTPMYSIYSNCNPLNIDDYNPKVILTIGNGLYAITKTDDIPSWKDFWEFKFNQTYFYTGFEYKNKIRVYPIPQLISWVDSDYCVIDNFEHFFVNKQLSFIRNYLSNYKPYTFIPCTSEHVKDVYSFYNKYSKERKVALDTETNTLIPFIENPKVGCITLSFDGEKGYFISTMEEDFDWKAFFEFIKNKKQIWANGKYDWEMLEQEAIKHNVECTCKIDGDVPIAFHLLSTERMKNSIKSLAWLIGFGGYDNELDVYLQKHKITNYLDIPLEILLPYSTIDAIVTYRLHEVAYELFKLQPKIQHVYEDIVLPVIEVYKDMEMQGIEVDLDYLNEFNTKLLKQIAELENIICEKLNKKFSVKSSDQLGQALEEFGFPAFGRSTKKYWTDKDGMNHFVYKNAEAQLVLWKNIDDEEYENQYSLEQLKNIREIASLILDFRALFKTQNTFAGNYVEENNLFSFDEEEIDISYIDDNSEYKENDGLVKHIRFDKKVHSNYGPARTNSLRSTCQAINLQAFSKLKEVRRILIPQKDYYFVEVDLAACHVRFLTYLSQDPVLLEIFKSENSDFHSVTAVNIFCREMNLQEFLKVKGEKPYSDYRKKAKTLNFSLMYGTKPITLIQTLKDNWSKQDILEYISKNDLELMINPQSKKFCIWYTVAFDIVYKFFNTYKGLERFIKQQHRLCSQGYVDNVYGFRRHLTYMTHKGDSPNWSHISNYENASVNGPVISLEAYHIYKYMKQIHFYIKKNNLKSYGIGMIHDSIILEIHKTEVELLYNVTSKIMKEDFFGIPLDSDFSLGSVIGFGDHTITNKQQLEECLIKEGIKEIQIIQS